MTRKLFLPALALFGLTAAAAAGAQEHNGPLKKDRECVYQCLQTVRTCLALARTDFRTCRETTCADEIADVQAACADDPNSEACKSALQALHDCVQPCRETGKAAGQACMSTSRGCVSDCLDEEPIPPKDRQCVSDCRDDLRDCTRQTLHDADTCRTGCGPLADAARAACAEDRMSDACQTARRAVYDCMEQCKETARGALHECVKAVDGCVRACPDRDPSEPPAGPPAGPPAAPRPGHGPHQGPRH
jgi:hypothetical protein